MLLMSSVNSQLPLNISLPEGLSFENYHAPCNQEAVFSLKRCLIGEGESIVYLWGGAGSGKSHLLQAACQMMAEQNRPIAYVPLSHYAELDVELLQGLENTALVCLDDVHAVAGLGDWEAGLFHFFNRVRESGVPLIMSASATPGQIALTLPDLSSRLAWGLVLHLEQIGDEEKIIALQIRARERGFDLPEEVGRYLLQHSPRNMDELFGLLDRLDEASLAAQRKLTIPFVRTLL